MHPSERVARPRRVRATTWSWSIQTASPAAHRLSPCSPCSPWFKTLTRSLKQKRRDSPAFCPHTHTQLLLRRRVRILLLGAVTITHLVGRIARVRGRRRALVGLHRRAGRVGRVAGVLASARTRNGLTLLRAVAIAPLVSFRARVLLRLRSCAVAAADCFDVSRATAVPTPSINPAATIAANSFFMITSVVEIALLLTSSEPQAARLFDEPPPPGVDSFISR